MKVEILSNIISLMVYLAPVPTFYRVYKKKTTEGFQSVPYVVALFSAMLWIYYAFLKSDAYLLITINSVGCVIETIYIAMYMTYAPRRARIRTAKFLLFLNLGVFCLILLFTLLLAKGPTRVRVLGWVCVGFSTSVFAAPLSIMRLVIRTKSVEFMPFYLSLFLTLSAIVWFSYGLLLKDFYIALPNILGFLFGIVQMLLYVIYKDKKPKVLVEEADDDHEKVAAAETTVIDVVKLKTVLGGSEIIIPAEVHLIEAAQIISLNNIEAAGNYIGEAADHEKVNLNEKNMEAAAQQNEVPPDECNKV
ncbi:SWEET sugar transporter [Macleaya cordata]|uniref:Bidirectional sugar transporter SWEET n=1 Tax=Macleaya cordata TaxID=56857 RepID=A0A200QGK8_MACCD|nr:SWEET sugar transporter [Macleaya cordata]